MSSTRNKRLKVKQHQEDLEYQESPEDLDYLDYREDREDQEDENKPEIYARPTTFIPSMFYLGSRGKDPPQLVSYKNWQKYQRD